MKLFILKIILWPSDRTKKCRQIEFREGMLNILTGESQSGKSTLTWIVDYCLGSQKCHIPVGLIREKAAWFGVQIRLNGSVLLSARQVSEDHQSSTKSYLQEGPSEEIVDFPEANSNIHILKNRLNQIAGLPNLDFRSGEQGEPYGGRASVRDLVAFNFQPQSVVANPNTLFFKTDTQAHREKLRIVFPLALGIDDARLLSIQHEIAGLDKELKRLSREYDAQKQATEAWKTGVESFYTRARELGLISQSSDPRPTWSLDRYVEELRPVVDESTGSRSPRLEPGATESAAAEVARLEAEEYRLSYELGTRRRRIARVEGLTGSIDQYELVLNSQRDRLKSVGWFERKIESKTGCPLCGSESGGAHSRVSRLKELAKELEDLASSVRATPDYFDKELADLRSEVREIERSLAAVRTKRADLEDNSDEAAGRRQRLSSIHNFVGQLTQALKSVEASRPDGGLSERIQEVEGQIEKLKSQIDPEKRRRRISDALSRVSRSIGEYSTMLELERSQDPISLNIRELTLQFTTPSGRRDHLWELGSGKNWVGYHLACLLSLHELFLSNPASPVPSFLMIDQPSQVYFPEQWPEIDRRPNTEDKTKQDKDIEGVRRIFEALSKMVTRADGKFQVIVTEHAGEMTWASLPNVHFVGNWRMGHDEFLIPRDWLESSPEARN